METPFYFFGSKVQNIEKYFAVGKMSAPYHTRIKYPGVGVTKPISSVPLFPQILSTVKTHVNYKT